VALALGTGAHAKVRLAHKFDHRHGLKPTSVTDIFQDERGFLWIGVVGGLYRYDGQEFRRWHDEALDDWVSEMAAVPGGGVQVLLALPGRIFDVVPGGLRPAFTDLDPPLNDVRSFAYDTNGSPWIVEARTLRTRDATGHWRTFFPEAFDGETFRKLVSARSGRVYLITSGGVWLLDDRGIGERLVALDHVLDLAEHPNGALYLLRWFREGELVELRDGDPVLAVSVASRPTELVVRGDTVWAAYAGNVVAYKPDAGVEILGPRHEFFGGGNQLFVDREDNLWLGSYLGLVQFPEPDTVAWAEEDGLSLAHTRSLARTSEGLWISSWGGLGRVHWNEEHGLTAVDEDLHVQWPMCVDRWDRMWTQAGHLVVTGILERSAGRARIHAFTGSSASQTCAVSHDGTVWLTWSEALLRTAPEGGKPVSAGRLPHDDGIGALFEDRDRRLWIASAGRVCDIATADLNADGDGWRCDDVPEMDRIQHIAETPSGRLWAATSNGVFRRSASGWELLPASRRLSSRHIFAVIPSPSGGMWVTGHGVLLRVTEREDLAAGWEVGDELSVWQGTLSAAAQWFQEDGDGTLWLATSAGAVQIPPQARYASIPPPSVELVDVLVDGERLRLDSEIRLPFARGRIELHFSALSFRDPERIRYRVRLQPDEPWAATRTSSFRFTDLAPGRYNPQVTASLDGENWSELPAGLFFRVLPPWYLQWWAVALFVLAAVAALYGVHRARTAVLLRLERQRTRIAMDLHDEMGAGLGSIGILADLVSAGDLAETERKGAAAKIAAAADDLGSSLRDILWSLRAPATDLESSASYLGERGGRMFPGDGVRFKTSFPDRWPSTRLSLAVRRNLQLIALEALHNVARHAAAENVELGFDPAGQEWRMWIADDGIGMPAQVVRTPERGLGLGAMRSRAEQIGAEIRWLPGKGGGTRVELRFHPRAEDRRVRRKRG
jgi:signal transduction histidine kinase